MGTWQNIKNLIGLGNNIVKAGSTALNILNKVSNRKVIDYKVPDMVPESDDITKIEGYYVINMKSAVKKITLAEYESNRLDLEWLYKYLKEALEATTYLIEANYFYRKNVLRLDNIGDNIDYYMNSAYYMKSDMYYYRIMLNKLMEQIMNDIRSMNTSEFKIDKSIEKIIEILAIE